MEKPGNISTNKEKKAKYLTPKDIEEMMQLSHGTVNKLFHVPGFPMVKIGKTMRVKEEDFETFMDSYKTHAINI